MTWLPFVCIALGALLSISKAAGRIRNVFDQAINLGLALLMLTLGAMLAARNSITDNLTMLGAQCVLIAVFAILGSVAVTAALEKTIFSLGEIRDRLTRRGNSAVLDGSSNPTQTPAGFLVWFMPGCLAGGFAAGWWLMPEGCRQILDQILIISLVILYLGVGFGVGLNRNLLAEIPAIGYGVAVLSAAVVIGSMAGGMIAGSLLNIPVKYAALAASGLSYYSITGAMMTQAHGLEAGVYGFLVNIAREVLTVLALPLLARISAGSPIAAGAAGNMDTMLVPVTRFVGMELGLVTLATGTVLTLFVPLLISLLLEWFG